MKTDESLCGEVGGWQRGVEHVNVLVPYAGHGDDFTGVYIREIYHLFKVWASCISPT